jgi:membrane protein
LLAAVVSVSGASSVLTTLMEGLRRAANLPASDWTFWQRRARSLLLVTISLAPLGMATLVVMFGQIFTVWAVEYLAKAVQPAFYGLALLARWVVALAGVVGVTELPSWKRTLPGAVVATLMWFVTTLAFGWYVTRFANYAQVYGPLGAGIALLFWLYIVFLSVLCGAEFNTLLRRREESKEEREVR